MEEQEGRVPDDVVDDDGVRGQEEVGETLRDLGELQPRAVENLRGKSSERACGFTGNSVLHRWVTGRSRPPPATDPSSGAGMLPHVPAGSTCHS